MKSLLKKGLGIAALALLLVSCGETDPGAGQSAAPRLLTTVAAATAAATSAQFEVTSLQKTGEARVSRTVYDYTYQVSIRNNGTTGAANVAAVLGAAPAGTTIVDGQVSAGSIGAGATVTPSDTVVLRIDRSLPFDASALAWNITSSTVRQLDPVKPAEVVVLSLADLGFPDGADRVTASGAVSDVLLKDGTLRFSTPGDTGVAQHAEFIVVSGGASTVLSQPITTERPTEIMKNVEATDEESAANPATLSITGLGPNNSFAGNPLTFRLQGVPALDLGDDSDGMVTDIGNAGINLKNYWTFHAEDNSFTVSGAKLQQLTAALPSGALTMSVNFVSKDGEFAASFDTLAINRGANVNGRLVTPQGAAATGLAGRKILLSGFNQRMRQVALVDAGGNFSFTNVIPDTYQLTLNDLDNPNVVSASTIVLPGTTTASVSIVYSLGGAAPKAPGAAAAKSFIGSSVTQNGAAPPARSIGGRASSARTPSALLADGAARFSATAGAQNATVTTAISYTVPQGTRNVGVTMTVFTEEYPDWTSQQSQYNDTWAYAVTGLPGAALSASGSVNQSHYTQGTISRTVCVDVTSQAQNGAFTVGGQVSATNIGDNQLPTVTTVDLSLGCAGLKVVEAKFTTPNRNGHPLIKPLNVSGNLAGTYLSVPRNGTDTVHTVPLEIKFSPADAQITEVKISVSPNATPAFASTNLLDQAHTIANGRIRFTGISLPAFPDANTNGKVAVTVQIKGKVDNTEVTSDPEQGGQVAFSGETAFTPLYLANDEPGLAGRRYNSPHDAGGDSWATRQTIAWLQSRAYRFDDISGKHITQTATGRSILDHSGHSDGQQIDMRYADGQGGYTDALGGSNNGAAIAQMINAARQEVASNAPQKPQLAALQAWIAANRTLLTAEAAAGSTRRIYVGKSFIKLALIDGVFSVNPAVAIPGVPAWTKPDRVVPADSHLNHWHLSTTAHP